MSETRSAARRLPAEERRLAIIRAALASEAVERVLDGRQPNRVIYVPGRLVNIV